MIVIIKQDLGQHLTDYMAENGWFLYQNQNGDFICEGAGEDPQSLIDSYNPWPAEKALKLAEINKWFADAVNQLTAGIPQEEKDSWGVQISEANGLVPIQMLPVMAAARGITLDELVAKVKSKAALFAQYYGAIQGKRDKAEDLIKSLPDSGSIERLPELWAIKCTD